MDEMTFSYPSPVDGAEIACYRWTPTGAPQALVQIAHGMGEHAARYRRFAETLTAAGFLVYASDHRGHGRTASGERGDFGEGGWEALVDDLGELGRLARSEHPGLRLGLFAHSMGSFAAQQYLLESSDEVDAVVLSGTTATEVLAGQLDPDVEPDLSGFNAGFEHRTGYEWLSRDAAEVDAYVADPACGHGIDPHATRGMVEGMVAAADVAAISAVNGDLPILVVSGTDDPLAGGGQLVEAVAARYREAGVRDVTLTLYSGARHEILNETNRDEVTADILAFLTRTLVP